jgi:hypothetical protein
MKTIGALSKKVLSINSNLGWHRYYVERFNKTESPDTCYLAMLYLFFALRDGETT